jgi:excisionase family DNA binding protein
MLTVQEAARILGRSPRTVRKRIHEGKLSAEWDGRWLINEGAVQRYSARRPKKTALAEQGQVRKPQVPTASRVKADTPSVLGCPDW